MKNHLVSFRKGWESENLARYILSKFSFIANPATVSDDIGSDFFCNLFQIIEEKGHEYLQPQNAFAIQIKSKSSYNKIEISKKIKYLESLKTPFFIGVIDRDKLILTIYSGEYLPELFSFKYPEKLEIALCEEIIDFNYYIRRLDADFTIKFPKVVEIKADICKKDLKEIIETISNLCDRIQKNIASRNNNEFIFYNSDGVNEALRIFAGKDSAKVFEEIFMKGLLKYFII